MGLYKQAYDRLVKTAVWDEVAAEDAYWDAVERKAKQMPTTTTTTRTPNGYRTVTQGSGTFRYGKYVPNNSANVGTRRPARPVRSPITNQNNIKAPTQFYNRTAIKPARRQFRTQQPQQFRAADTVVKDVEGFR
jgi:hypothetical protein